MRKLIIILSFLVAFCANGQRYGEHIGLLVRPANIVYGYNGVWSFSGRSLSDAETLDSLKTLPLFDVYRYPGGTVANSFNWHTGKDDDGSGTAYTPDDVKVLVDSVGCDILFVLNMLTHTMADQLALLAYANGIGIEIKYVELGNEFNNINNPGHITFPTPQDYADEAATWRDAIKAIYPSCLVAFIGGNRRAWDGGDDWNAVMMTKNPDALTWHESPNLDQFYSGGVVSVDDLITAIVYDFGFDGMNLITSVPIWVTESNYTWDQDNLMSSDNQILTTFNLTKKISELIQDNNHSGVKIFCVRGIEGLKQGAFYVTGPAIIRQATSEAMAQWEQIYQSANQ